MALCPAKGSGSQGRRSGRIPSQALFKGSPWPAGAAPWPGSQRMQPGLQAVVLASWHPKSQLWWLGTQVWEMLLQPSGVTGSQSSVPEAGRAQVSRISHPSPLAHIQGS